MSGFRLQRIGMLMEPEPGNPQEVEGVLDLPPEISTSRNWSSLVI